MNRIALDFGPVQIYWYSIFILLGLLAGAFVVYKEANRRGIDEEFLTNLIFNTLVFGFIGARLYYVLFNLSYYLQNPIEILEIWNGGLAIHGGIFAGLLVIIIYCKKHNVDVLRMLDILVVGLFIGQAIGRWGNFFNGEAYGGIATFQELSQQGIPVFIIRGMYILGEYREPTFFYESIWCFGGFLAMLIIRRYPYLKKGQLSGFYLVWYGIARLIIEGMRSDSLMIGSFKMAQIVSSLFIITGIILFFYNIKKSTKKDPKLYTHDAIKKESSITYLKVSKH